MDRQVAVQIQRPDNKPVTIKLDRCPDEIWTWLRPGQPQLPTTLTMRSNAFLEDAGHDWLWSEARKELRFSSLGTAGLGEVWLVLVYNG